MLVSVLLPALVQPSASSCGVADELEWGAAIKMAPAIEAIRAWTAGAARLHGAPLITPVIFQVKFGLQ